jgi:hypothetical protein
MIDIDFNEIFTYDNGKLYWKKKISDKCVIGKEAGYHNQKTNRHFVSCYGKPFSRSRVVYAMFNGFSEKKILENLMNRMNANRVRITIEGGGLLICVLSINTKS